MNDHELLIALGRNIFNHIIEDTNPGEEFLLSIIDPDTFDKLKEKTGDLQQVGKALKSTGKLCSVPDDYTAITVATLQVSLIYSETNITDNSFYSKVKKYYPDLDENSDIQRYFEYFQEPLWEKARDSFARKDRHLCIPPRKTGSGRYVQFPKSQQLISWSKLVEYADKFINLTSDRFLSFEDFCDRVPIEYIYDFSPEENEVIRKIIFSFYSKWDGRSTADLKNRPHESLPKKLFESSLDERKILTIRKENENIVFYSDGNKVSEDSVKNGFRKSTIPFLYDEEYEEWVYTNKSLHSKDRIIVLKNKQDTPYNKNFTPEFSTQYYKVYLFDNGCNNTIAEFANLTFISKEYFTVIGGIQVVNCYYSRNNVLGAWYNFALPKIKIDYPKKLQVFIDSKEIVVNKNQIDLSNLILAKSNAKWSLEPKREEYSLKCTDLPPVYFKVSDTIITNTIGIKKGWKLSALCPVKLSETPDIIGLMLNKPLESNNKDSFRSFLQKIDYLQNRIHRVILPEKINRIEKRRVYGN